MRFVFLLVLFVSIVFAETVSQTDWSGGGGVQGPVSEWNESFWSSDAGVFFTGGKLKLLPIPMSPIEHNVDGYVVGATSVYSVDIDGDGDSDVLGSASSSSDDIIWWENIDGLGTSWTKHTIDGNFQGAVSVYSTDVDGDGDYDVLGAAFYDDEITWWENEDGTGASWTEHIIVEGYLHAASVYSDDVDGDGDADVLGAAASSDEIAWWENLDGTGASWTKHIVAGDFDGTRSVYSTDVDGDGDVDILGAASVADEITWWENTDGAGTVWTEHIVDGDFDGAMSVSANDVDGDGDADLLGAAYYGNDITWWENTDGTGTSWTEHTVAGNFAQAWSVYSTDVDGDGDADILGAGSGNVNVTWWENTYGTGVSWSGHIVSGDFNGAMSVYATDVDGDGNTDVLAAASDADKIVWWDVMGFPSEGTLESSILDVGDVAEWNAFLAGSQEPAGTSLSLQLRSSDNPSAMGAWSDTVYSSSGQLEGILTDFTRFLQYKVILETFDPEVSPELAFVTLSYTVQVGVSESESSEVPSLSLSVSENPSTGFFSAVVSVPEDALVELSLYDVSGRVVTEVSEELPAGTHSVNFAGLAHGVYFCTMRTGSFTATERVVVLR